MNHVNHVNHVYVFMISCKMFIFSGQFHKNVSLVERS